MMNHVKTGVIVGFCLMVATLIIVSMPSVISAQVDPVLPPRPTPDSVASTESESAVGSTIQLSIPADKSLKLTAESWAIVQWQDRNNQWNDVEGWQGNLSYEPDSASWEVVWWVDRSNFGENSFRWVIYSDSTKSSRLATSVTFDLPENHRQGVVVKLK